MASGAAGASAYSGRRDAVDVKSMPVAYVYGSAESAEPTTLGRNKRNIEWTLTVNVDLYDVETLASEIETTLDTKTTLINQAIDTDTTLGGIVTDIHITDRDFEYESAGANSLGVARMKYQVSYTTYEA